MRKVLLLILSLAGLFDALYLWWVYSSPTHPIVCLDTGCDLVRASRYAHLWGLPLPIYGVAMYLALAAAILAQGWITSPSMARLAQWKVTLISAGGFAFSLYLTALEAFVIHAYCTWCVGSAVIITLIFALSLVDLRREPATESAGAPTGRLKVLRKEKEMVAALVIVAVIGGLAFRWLA